ncbi:MAG: chromate resistance protein [Chloroflexi bacterium]|nr:chromate resistance protein [Chloroflexota bacterium]
MKWITWENVGVDRIACAWLICRCLDPRATFVFVPVGQKPLPPGNTFDIPGSRYSHHREHCTFYTLLREFDLRDPILQRIARIVDEADVVQAVTIEPTASGLDLICRGIRLTSPDDTTAIERGRLIYDALYAQLVSDTGLPITPKAIVNKPTPKSKSKKEKKK